MSLASELNGVMTRDEIERLKFPVAWSGTMPADEGARQEAELRKLAREALEQLQAAYDASDSDDAEYAVRFEDGEIVEIVEAD